ncbi:hypothetical protein Plec18167_003006 [Paecilomyces lecythidis]|uniref:Uncharacterized protein n=1 Tax=Paecilomyces lecythidis TaxID=3004212 RepID=A0ABR3Y4F6_9EURO
MSQSSCDRAGDSNKHVESPGGERRSFGRRANDARRSVPEERIGGDNAAGEGASSRKDRETASTDGYKEGYRDMEMERESFDGEEDEGLGPDDRDGDKRESLTSDSLAQQREDAK